MGSASQWLARMLQVSGCSEPSKCAMLPGSVTFISQIVITTGSHAWTQVSQALFLVGSADEAMLSSELPCLWSVTACQRQRPRASAPISRSAGGDFLMKTADEAMWSAGLLRSCRKLAPWLLKSTAVHRCPKWYLICNAA